MSSSSLERTFDGLCAIFCPQYADLWTEQCYFSLDRDWRLDRAIIGKLLYVELHGGGYVQGRHSREAGMSSDFEKGNAAVVAGWRGLYATTSMLHDDPEPFFVTLVALLEQPIYYPNIELSAWTARVRNLTKAGGSISANGVTVERLKNNEFFLSFSSGGFSVGGNHVPLRQAQGDVIDLILRGVSESATPGTIRSSKRRFAPQSALFGEN